MWWNKVNKIKKIIIFFLLYNDFIYDFSFLLCDFAMEWNKTVEIEMECDALDWAYGLNWHCSMKCCWPNVLQTFYYNFEFFDIFYTFCANLFNVWITLIYLYVKFCLIRFKTISIHFDTCKLGVSVLFCRCVIFSNYILIVFILTNGLNQYSFLFYNFFFFFFFFSFVVEENINNIFIIDKFDAFRKSPTNFFLVDRRSNK